MKKIVLSTMTIILVSLSAGAQESNKCNKECEKKCDKKECTSQKSCDHKGSNGACTEDIKCSKKSKKCKANCTTPAVKPD